MRIFLVFISVVFLNGHLNAQGFIENSDTDLSSPGRLTIEDFSYPTFLDGEIHSNFTVAYEFDADFLLELQGFYDTYRLNDVFDINLRARRYFLEKLYLFSGIGAEIEIDKHGLAPPPPRIKVTHGFGYEVDEKFSLEAKHDLHFNRTNFGNYGTPNLFSLSGKYKF